MKILFIKETVAAKKIIPGSYLFFAFWSNHLEMPSNIIILKDLAKFSKGSSQLAQTSLRRLQDVLKRSRRLTTKQDVVTTAGKRRQIYDVLKTSDLRRLEDVQFTTSWRRLISVILKKSNLRRLEDVWFITSWKRL